MDSAIAAKEELAVLTEIARGSLICPEKLIFSSCLESTDVGAMHSVGLLVDIGQDMVLAPRLVLGAWLLSSR